MIEIRTHNDFAKQAALRGVKIDFKQVKRKMKELSDENKEMILKVSREAAQRKLMEKAEKARKKANGNHK